jgi:hypothetical protein
MNGDESFLHQDAAELERFLIHHARRDRAPRAAYERALASLASVSLATGLTASAKLAWGASAVSQVTPWVVAKWIAVGMTASLLTFGAAEGLYQTLGGGETSSHESKQPARPAPLRAAADAEGVAQPQPEAPGAVRSSHPIPAPANAPARSIEASAPQPDSAQIDDQSASGSPASGSDAEQLSREVTRLRRARALLVGSSPASALEVLNGYTLEFPSGTLRIEAAALRIEAFVALGDRAAARRLATEFLASFPSSPLATRVRQISGLAAEGQKP